MKEPNLRIPSALVVGVCQISFGLEKQTVV